MRPSELKSNPIQNWNFLQDSKLGISRASLDGLEQGRSLISTVYVDAMTGKNILSFLTPVYFKDKLKGVVMVDVTAQEIEALLYTSDRPLVWRYLDITLKDSDTGALIEVHHSKNAPVELRPLHPSGSRKLTDNSVSGCYVFSA